MQRIQSGPEWDFAKRALLTGAKFVANSGNRRGGKRKSVALPTPPNCSLELPVVMKRVKAIVELIEKIPLTLKTHETQEAARHAAQAYLNDLQFTARLAITLKNSS